MDKAQQFTQSLWFIIAFLVALILSNMMFGETFTTGFLWLVLLSMVLINSQDIISLPGRFGIK